jgi:regulator of RNase E activity RraA
MNIPSDIYMGIIYDCMRLIGYKDAQKFFIDIKPKCGYSKLIHGEILTTYGEQVSDAKITYEELDKIRLQIYNQKHFKNNPIVFLEANDDKVAHSGDITSLIYQKLGAKGFVTDGNVRDVDIIEKIKFPVFCKNTNPIDAIDYWAITKYFCPIEMNGVFISNKDYAFASKDGIIVVPKRSKKKLLPVLEEQLQRENKIRETIKEGNKTPLEILKQFGRW